MALDDSGFLRPTFARNLTNKESGRASLVCPATTLDLPAHDVDIDLHWGPVVASRVGWSADGQVRHQGSSGGVVSSLLIDLLERRQVAFVTHVAVSESDPLKNEYVLSRTRAEVLRGAGSRYSPSAPLENIDRLFGAGQRFAFVGKPCDVAALRNYCRMNPECSELLVLAVSFLCAGTPSIHATHEVLGKLGVERDELSGFQYRGNGWPGYATATTKAGRVSRMSYAQSWGEVLGRQLQLRCKLCPDGTGEFADVSCGDAWYGEDGYPDFEERDGRSLILARTKAGESAVRAAMASGAIVAEPIALKDASAMQPYQMARKESALARWLAVAAVRGVLPGFRGLRLGKALRRAGIVSSVRNAIGMARRLVGREAM